MPPKRKAARAGATPVSGKALSKTAKDNGITAQQEMEIRECFELHCEPYGDEDESVLPIDDVRGVLCALGLPPRDSAELGYFVSILDPENEGFATYEALVTVCASKIHDREKEGVAVRENELDDAFRLFSSAGGNAAADDTGGTITLTHLKRVAAVLKTDTSNEQLRDMILEANGGTGVARGVTRDEFHAVMKRAGVW